MKQVMLAVALTLAVAGQGAAAQTDSVALSAKKRQASGQIACTVFGCHPIPRGCRIVTQYDFWGNPTGFDAVICPRR
jgi:hypothetical protein